MHSPPLGMMTKTISSQMSPLLSLLPKGRASLEGEVRERAKVTRREGDIQALLVGVFMQGRESCVQKSLCTEEKREEREYITGLSGTLVMLFDQTYNNLLTKTF